MIPASRGMHQSHRKIFAIAPTIFHDLQNVISGTAKLASLTEYVSTRQGSIPEKYSQKSEPKASLLTQKREKPSAYWVGVDTPKRHLSIGQQLAYIYTLLLYYII